MVRDQIVKNCVLVLSFIDSIECIAFYIDGYLTALVDTYEINNKEFHEIRKEILTKLGL